MSVSPRLSLLTETIDICRRHGRADLAHRLCLRHAESFTGVRVAVAGFSKQGKSSLVNALINAPVCATGDSVSTAVPTEIRYASEASAALVRKASLGYEVERRDPISADQVASEVAQAVPGALARGIDHTLIRAEIGVPRELLTSLVLIDTPALGDPRSEKNSAALAVLATAHVVLLVSDAMGELSSSELSLAKQLRTWCPSMVVVLTKIDLCSDWRAIAERNRVLLAEIGVQAPVCQFLRSCD